MARIPRQTRLPLPPLVYLLAPVLASLLGVVFQAPGMALDPVKGPAATAAASPATAPHPMGERFHGHGLTRINRTVYARNRQRVVVPAGPAGPLGDQVIANGLLYANPTDATPIGVFDLVAFTTSVDGAYERRQVFIELSIDSQYIRNTWLPSFPLIAAEPGGRSDLNLMGTETYPTGGGVLVEPLHLGVAAGTGLLQDLRGVVTVSHDPATQVFAYRLSGALHPGSI